MTTAQALIKDDIYRRIDKLSYAEMNLVSEYLDELEYHEPNDETLAAFKEAENLDNLQGFDSLQDMFNALGVKYVAPGSGA